MKASQNPKTVLASPRGFCAGVVRAVDIVKTALRIYGAPIYVRKEIVHNSHVVKSLRGAGAIFVESLAEVSKGSIIIFSAHGVSPAVHLEAQERGLQIIDATCPLVTKVHNEAIRFARQGHSIALVGHKDHDEVIGTAGEAPEVIQVISTAEEVAHLDVPDPDKVAVITQTTLSLDDTREVLQALRKRFPKVVLPSKDDICYATQNRQNAVKEMAKHVDVVFVLGSANSSNARRLCEVAQKAGARAFLIDHPQEIDPRWIEEASAVGITAGASTPEEVVQAVINHLRSLGSAQVEELQIAQEEVSFPMPLQLISSNRIRQ